jgi:hypothetical protein
MITTARLTSLGRGRPVWGDSTDAELVAFARLWASNERAGDAAQLPSKKHMAFLKVWTMTTVRHGFAGSGEWTWTDGTVTYRIVGYANGNTFWGTSYTVTRIGGGAYR